MCPWIACWPHFIRSQHLMQSEKELLEKFVGKKRCFKSHQPISIRLSLVSSLSIQQEYIFYESNLETIMCFLFIGEFFQLKNGEGSGNSGVFRRMSSLKPQGDELRTAIQNQWSDTEGQWQERKMNSCVSQYREKGENEKVRKSIPTICHLPAQLTVANRPAVLGI